MLNLLGDAWCGGVPDWQSIVADSRTKLHLYGKQEPRAGRKMGHITCLDDSLAAALARAFRIKELIARRLVAVA